MAILLTGAAGFIGFHVATALLKRGEDVIGIDNLNPYYDVKLKEARLAELEKAAGFTFHKLDVADGEAMAAFGAGLRNVDRILHLAAQAGVRYSFENPEAYIASNVDGQLNLLELARRIGSLKHFVYASSSSVYGGNTKLPFSVRDAVEKPISLYAATKRAGELMAVTYSHLHNLPATGLRFFTVYGPWGRPDMSAYIFAKLISEGKPIPVFNNGEMMRDFTFIDDIVAGVLAAIDRPPPEAGHRLYNLGNHRSEPLMRFIELIETALGRKAEIDFQPMQRGDVKETYADITESERDLDFHPRTTIDKGVPRFIAWFRDYHGL
ncbi:MAG: NAD-dependent epimerase/dehydratase family protein [Alphaproteobacteria bacterium]|nr:NAD-dependent epimerase/dehydratase family protein [Alphaproteobacteria bacterium]